MIPPGIRSAPLHGKRLLSSDGMQTAGFVCVFIDHLPRPIGKPAWCLDSEVLGGDSKPIGEPIQARRMEYGWEIPLGATATVQYVIEVVH